MRAMLESSSTFDIYVYMYVCIQYDTRDAHVYNTMCVFIPNVRGRYSSL